MLYDALFFFQELLKAASLPHYLAVITIVSGLFLAKELLKKGKSFGRDVALATILSASFIFSYQYSHWAMGKQAPAPVAYASVLLDLSKAAVSPAHASVKPEEIIDLMENSEENQEYAPW